MLEPSYYTRLLTNADPTFVAELALLLSKSLRDKEDRVVGITGF
jgi:hypothetical protein